MSGDVYAVAGSELLRTTDLGNTWSQLSTARSIFVEKSGDVLRADIDNTISRSTDSGNTWIPLVYYGSYEVVTSPVVSNSDGLILTSTAYIGPGQFWIPTGLKRSTDSGATWELVWQDFRPRQTSASANGWILAGNDAATGDSSLFRTSDGMVWTSARSGLTGAVHGLAPCAGRRVLAATSNGLYTSSDDGETWTATTLVGLDVACVDVNPTGDIFAAVDTAVYRSSDSGSRWDLLASGLPGSAITCILASNDGYMYVGTSTMGIYRSSHLTTSTRNAEWGLPPTFQLLQNYPNPFNPATTIRFEIPGTSEVRLSILDMLGREVRVLLDERREAGFHEVRFNASGLASGSYICRLRAGGTVQSRRLMLLR